MATVRSTSAERHVRFDTSPRPAAAQHRGGAFHGPAQHLPAGVSEAYRKKVLSFRSFQGTKRKEKARFMALVLLIGLVMIFYALVQRRTQRWLS